jgi:hypothetical protein
MNSPRSNLRSAWKQRRHFFRKHFHGAVQGLHGIGEQHGFRVYWLILVAVVLLCIGVLWTVEFRPARTLIAVTANTEVLEVVTFDGERTVIALPPAIVQTDSEAQGRCLTGALTVALNSKMTLVRQGMGPLKVRIEPSTIHARAGVFEDAGHTIHTYREPITITFDPLPESNCKLKATNVPAPVVRIPLMGALTLGTDFSPQTGADAPVPLLLHSGHIETFTRAIDKFLSIPLTRNQGVLYPTGSVDLPPGARLRECAPTKRRVAWFGYAEMRRYGADVSDRNMDVVAYTEAPNLSLTSPGGEKTGGVACESETGNGSGTPTVREDVLGVSVLARLVADPILATIAVLLAAFSVVLPTMISLHMLALAKRDASTHRKGKRE